MYKYLACVCDNKCFAKKLTFFCCFPCSSDFCGKLQCIIAHTAKIIAKILRRRIERKIEAVLGEDQFGFRRGKGTRDAIGMMRIIAE